MRLEDLVLRIPGDEFQVHFHEHLTVLSGIGMLERQALADSIIGALTGNAEQTVVTLIDRTGRPIEIVSSGGVASCRYLDDDSRALPLVGTVATTADSLRALMLVQAGDLGLMPTGVRVEEHPELADARATLNELAKELKAAKSGRSVKEQLRDQLNEIAAQIHNAEESTARREYAAVLAELERVRAESAALQGGEMGADADQHLLDSAADARALASKWQQAASQVTRLVCHTPAERFTADELANVRWFPDNVPSNFPAIADELVNARRERDHLEGRLRDLATSKLPEPSDPRIIDLATLDQGELWSAAEAVIESGRMLAREQVAMGGLSSANDKAEPIDSSTLDVIARIEETHRVVEDLEAACDRRRVPSIAGAGILAAGSLLFAAASPVVGLGLLAGAAGGAFWGLGLPIRQLADARRVEKLALADADAETYLGFHIRRVEATITPGIQNRLEDATITHRVALAKWQHLVGPISVDDAKAIESDVRAYAIALGQLGNAAGELDTLRSELTDRAEPAVAAARETLFAACAAYGIDEMTVETTDASALERLMLEQVDVGKAARSQETLEEAEADEEKLANALDDLLHQLGFRDGTLDARTGALDWAVDRASERQEARTKARSREDIEEDLTRLQNESRRLRRPEWASVQASDADGPDVEVLKTRHAELKRQLDSTKEVVVDVDRLADRHAAMERRVASLESQLEHDHPESVIAQVADVHQYLLAHLTKAGHCGASDESVPVILDDPFLRIAADRKWELLDMLRRLGENTQLIYLTDDPFVSAWARRRAAAGLITLLEPVDA